MAHSLAISTTSLGWGALLALGGTGAYHSDATFFLPLTLALAGPSAGHVYAGAHLRGFGTTALRGGSLAGIAYTSYVYSCFAADDWEKEHWYQRGPCEKTWPELVLRWGSIATIAGTSLWDMVDAGYAVKRVEARRERKAQLTLAPSVIPGDEGPAAGLAAQGSF